MTRNPARACVALLLVCIVGAWSVNAEATTVKHRTIVDLIALSDIIVSGTVVQVTDGIDANNFPYTEVTMSLNETIRGGEKGTFTFRQFGLLEPRDMGDGTVNLNTTLDGWPRYAQDQEVILFLYKASPMNGFRTTVGLLQGKFTVDGASLANAINNRGLFDDVAVDEQALSAQELKMFQAEEGVLNRESFITFVRKAVDQGWIETGRLGNE